MDLPNTYPKRTGALSSLLISLLIATGCGGDPWAHAIDEEDAAGDEAGVLLSPLKEAHQWVHAVPAENAGRIIRVALPLGPQLDVQRAEYGELLILNGALPTEAAGPVDVTLVISTGTPPTQSSEAGVDRESFFAGTTGRHRRYTQTDDSGRGLRTATWQSETDGGYLYFSATARFASERPADSKAAWDELLYTFRAVAKSLTQKPPSVFGSVGHSQLINYLSIEEANRAKLTFPGTGSGEAMEVILSVPADWEVFGQDENEIELSLSLSNHRIAVLGMTVSPSEKSVEQVIADRSAIVGRGDEQNARILNRGQTFLGELPALSYTLVDTRTIGDFPARHMTTRWVTHGAGLEIEVQASIFGYYQDMGIADDLEAFLPLFHAIANTLEIAPAATAVEE